MGVVKITPAHDPNDFEVGVRHNLECIVIMNDDATMNEQTGKYEGLTREECRKKVLDDLESTGLLLKVEPITHEVGHSERTGFMLEPMIKKQRFVKKRPLAGHVLETQKKSEEKVNIIPEWCISRQLWWGHQIPAWYKNDEIYVGMEAPKEEGWMLDLLKIV